ncbi:MAG: hypothetical protein K2H46_04370 [Muribaculaceae bacterium]|nr:hypothetical protein [Muribaculaceae bacterium]
MATKREKIAVARIFADLIKADRIVDIGEMEYWEEICSKYGINREIHLEAKHLSFSDALTVICNSDDHSLKPELLADCRRMTVSDGFCAHSEALIISAITFLLDKENNVATEVYSIPRSNFNIDMATMVYVESDYDKETNEAIISNYRAIFRELQIAGFHFIYLPQIIGHYKETEPTRFKQILSFLAPDLSEENINAAYSSLVNMTTDRFCEDILCNKCGIDNLRHTYPALLLKFGNSYVGDVEYANYLKIEVGNDILTFVQHFVDNFCKMLSSDLFIVKSSEERDNQFHFFGFYKQLLEIFIVRKNIRSKVEINLHDQQIRFPGIDRWLNEVNRRERALYTLLLCQGKEGLNFKKPIPSQLDRYERRMKKYQKRFEVIYQMMGGERTAPDLSKTNNRSPMLTHLNGCLKKLPGLYNPQDYVISQGEKGHYFVHLPSDYVQITPMLSDLPEPLLDSELYKRVMSIK